MILISSMGTSCGENTMDHGLDSTTDTLITNTNTTLVPQFVQGPRISDYGKNYVKVVYDTDVLTSSKIIYGRQNNDEALRWEYIDSTSASTDQHTTTLKGLDPGMTFYFRVVIADEDGVENQSEIMEVLMNDLTHYQLMHEGTADKGLEQQNDTADIDTYTPTLVFSPAGLLDPTFDTLQAHWIEGQTFRDGYMRRWNFGNATWSAHQATNVVAGGTSSGNWLNGVGIQQTNNKITMGWVDAPSGLTPAVATADYDGTTWETETRLNHNDNESATGRVAIISDADGSNMFVGWTETPTPEQSYVRQKSINGTWSTEVLGGTSINEISGTGSTFLSLAYGELEGETESNLYAGFAQVNNQGCGSGCLTHDVYVRQWNGAAWSTLGNKLNDDAGRVSQVQVVVANEALYAIYDLDITPSGASDPGWTADSKEGNIFIKEWEGSSWSAPLSIPVPGKKMSVTRLGRVLYMTYISHSTDGAFSKECLYVRRFDCELGIWLDPIGGANTYLNRFDLATSTAGVGTDEFVKTHIIAQEDGQLSWEVYVTWNESVFGKSNRRAIFVDAFR